MRDEKPITPPPAGPHRPSLPPAFLPGLGLVAGLWLAGSGPAATISVVGAAAVALLALGVAAPFGRCLCALALGAAVGAASGEAPGASPGFEPERPVTVRGRVASHWSCREEACAGWLEILAIHQGPTVTFHPERSWARIYGLASPPALGATLRLRGLLRPGRSGGWALTVKTAALAEPLSGPGPIGRLSSRLRGRIEASLEGTEPGPGSGLLRAFLLSDASDLPEAWRRGLRRAGLYHLLAASGLHVALLAGALWLITTPLARHRRLRLSLMLAIVAAYVLLVGPVASLLRSALMGGLALAALWLARPPDSRNTLVLSAAGLALAGPGGAQDLSLQLSFLATFGLIALSPRLGAAWTFGPRWLRRGVAASVGAELATLPVALPRFHLFPLAAPLLDLVFVPWSALCLILSLLWAALSPFPPQLHAWIPPSLEVLAFPAAWLAEVPGWVPLALPLSAGTLSATLLTCALGALLLGPPQRLWLALLLTGLLFLRPAVPGGQRELVMLDVGQGDAFLLRDGDRALLIDGGGFADGDFAAAVLLPALLDEGLPELEAVVLTHGDVDHCGGLVDLASYLRLGELWAGSSIAGSECGAELAATFALSRRRVLATGDVIVWRGWRLRVLSPEPGSRVAQDNESSLVLLAETHGLRVLLTGDIGETTERRLVGRWGNGLEAEVLKVGHHGSARSSSLRFLATVRPRLALISAGRGNRYGHPAASALERLAWSGARVLSTDRHGRVRVTLAPSGGLAASVDAFPVGGPTCCPR
ncbi:MAG TPA: DNA internalization-related competence protein ComEC/Rec2 [Thermoanaerobaculia bacterium]|nr:DNA internalization-related competence protein ComEC/Rec2 [Thermoanaerobaculia bacterium]